MSNRADPALIVQCAFVTRTPAADGKFTYEQIQVDARDYRGRLPTAHPPAVGDTVWLWDRYKKEGGIYKVVERHWSHPMYLSGAWPHGEPWPTTSPTLDMLVEPAEGLYRDEAPIPEEDEDS